MYIPGHFLWQGRQSQTVGSDRRNKLLGENIECWDIKINRAGSGGGRGAVSGPHMVARPKVAAGEDYLNSCKLGMSRTKFGECGTEINQLWWWGSAAGRYAAYSAVWTNKSFKIVLMSL